RECARTRWPHAANIKATIISADWLAFDDFVGREIFGGQEAWVDVGIQRRNDVAGYFTGIERRSAVLGEDLQRLRIGRVLERETFGNRLAARQKIIGGGDESVETFGVSNCLG